MLEAWISLFKRHDLWLEGSASGSVDIVTSDSRSVLDEKETSKKIVFFARKGATRDGHEFLASLQSHPQIKAFVVEKIPADFKPTAPVIIVRDARLAMSLAVKDLYKNPTAGAFTFAVTGTNGKTTTTFLMEALLSEIKKRPVRLGTIETSFENFKVPSDLTTPDFTVLQKTFSELKARGADAFVFEASSHALDQGRLLGLELDAALFTNLTPEHLDYHKTMEIYYQAKRKLFVEVLLASPKQKKIAVLHHDGAYGSRLAEELRVQQGIEVVTWGFEKDTHPQYLHIQEWKTDLFGSTLTVSGLGVKNETFKTKLVGKYNIENIAGIIAFALAYGCKPEVIQSALINQPPVFGRLERVNAECKGSIFVDYAHTPDALENVLATLRPLTKGKLKVVFGCGGDRDRTKRPKMGAIAELYCDELFVTSDNPRTEDPDAIIEEILGGIQRIKPIHINSDRKQAIQKSLEGLQSNDVVLIAGKGHENYQILGTKKIHFDDREVVLEAACQRKDAH